jgi:hypothetical protein
MSIRTTLMAAAMLICSCHCGHRFVNIHLSGNVFSASDSTPVPSAMIIAALVSTNSSVSWYCQTDQDGAFTGSSGSRPAWIYDPVSVEVTVIDADGEENGVFVSRDTLFYSENPDSETDFHFSVDFYVDMVR